MAATVRTLTEAARQVYTGPDLIGKKALVPIIKGDGSFGSREVPRSAEYNLSYHYTPIALDIPKMPAFKEPPKLEQDLDYLKEVWSTAKMDKQFMEPNIFLDMEKKMKSDRNTVETPKSLRKRAKAIERKERDAKKVRKADRKRRKQLAADKRLGLAVTRKLASTAKSEKVRLDAAARLTDQF